MTDLRCREARALAARAELGELSEAEAMRLELHLQGCEACAAGEARVRGLAALLADGGLADEGLADEGLADDGAHDHVRMSDRALVAAALMQAGDRPAPRAERAGRGILRYAAAAAAVLAIGGAIGAAWWAQTRPEPIARPAPAHDDTTVEAPDRPVLPEAPATIPDREPGLAAGRGTPCPGVVAEASPDSDSRVLRSEPHRCRLGLERGELTLRVDPSASTALIVETPTSLVRVLGTVLSIRVDEHGTRVVVERGLVEVEAADDSRRVGASERAQVSAGARVAVDHADEESLEPLRSLARSLGLPVASDPAPPAAHQEAHPQAQRRGGERQRVARLRRMLRDREPAAVRREVREEMRDPQLMRRRAELLTIVAESYALEGEHASALETYADVWQGPRSATAGNALVAGADLALLRLSDPGRARGLYERYVREYPEGALREVATAGRCRALHAGGDARAAARCVEAYREAYPNGRFNALLER